MLKYKISWEFVHWDSSSYMQAGRQTDGRAEHYDEAKSRFSQFLERPYKG